MWAGWHKVGAPMRDRYARFVELSNQGARELGYGDTGTLWRSAYDMTPEAVLGRTGAALGAGGAAL